MPHYVNIMAIRTGRGFLWSQASDTRPQPQYGEEFCRLEHTDDGAITIVVFDPAVTVIAEGRPDRPVPADDDFEYEAEETPW